MWRGTAYLTLPLPKCKQHHSCCHDPCNTQDVATTTTCPDMRQRAVLMRCRRQQQRLPNDRQIWVALVASHVWAAGPAVTALRTCSVRMSIDSLSCAPADNDADLLDRHPDVINDQHAWGTGILEVRPLLPNPCTQLWFQPRDSTLATRAKVDAS
jgi:hypothetical protein